MREGTASLPALHLAKYPVLPQNVVRSEMFAAIPTRVTNRAELRPLRALPTAGPAGVEHGIRVSPAARAVHAHARRSGGKPDFRLGCASCVAMMQSADHREGDDLPSIYGLPRAGFGGVLVEREVGPGSVIVLEVLPKDTP